MAFRGQIGIAVLALDGSKRYADPIPIPSAHGPNPWPVELPDERNSSDSAIRTEKKIFVVAFTFAGTASLIAAIKACPFPLARYSSILLSALSLTLACCAFARVSVTTTTPLKSRW
jgi:hypothetical protein